VFKNNYSGEEEMDDTGADALGLKRKRSHDFPKWRAPGVGDPMMLH